MYIFGKKIYKVGFVYDTFGEVIKTKSNCVFCDNSFTFRIKVCYNEGDFWDDMEEVDICSDCLISDGFFIDEEDMDRSMYGK